jgi:hypothetical protein
VQEEQSWVPVFKKVVLLHAQLVAERRVKVVLQLVQVEASLQL